MSTLFAFLLLSSCDRARAQTAATSRSPAGLHCVVHDTRGKDSGARVRRCRARRHDLGRRAGGAGRRDSAGTTGKPWIADRTRRGARGSADEGGSSAIRMDRACRTAYGSRDAHAAAVQMAAWSRRCQCRSILSLRCRAAPVQAGVTLPPIIQIGRPATIRGRSTARLRGKTVDVGGRPADCSPHRHDRSSFA